MDAFSDPAVETVVVMSSAQVGKTTEIENVIGHYIHQDPSPILLLQPTLEMAETFSKDRLAPMLRDTPALRGLVKDARSRDSGNTLLHKQFPGGHITMAGANSPASLASRPIRVVLCDEVDRYPASAGTEGDPVSLARKRATTFWNRKIGLFSTPGTRGLSRIEKAYENSDQRRYWVPCAECGEYQVMMWQQVRWVEPADAHYECYHCRAKWDDVTRWRAIKQGEWRAGAEFKGTAGFWLNELCSPWSKVAGMVEAFLEAKPYPEQLKTWVNTSLGETWQERGDAPDWEILKGRAADYELATVPEGVLFLTAGVDVQKDRVELSIWGWGRAKRSWLINHFAIPGDTSRRQTWDALTEALMQTYRTPGGLDLSIIRTCVDSGYAAQEVYAWARTQAVSSVMVIKGQDSGAALVGVPSAVDVGGSGKKIRRGVKVWPVNVSMAKSELYGFLRLAREGNEVPAGWVHIPAMDDEFYKQLTAEQFVTRVVKGYKRGEWQKTRERNEALDCRVYARAAAASVGLDRFGEGDFAALEAHLRNVPAPPRTPAVVEQPAPPAPEARPAPRPGWMGRQSGWFSR